MTCLRINHRVKKKAWSIFSANYLNYNKLINDMFKNKPPSKPKKKL